MFDLRDEDEDADNGKTLLSVKKPVFDSFPCFSKPMYEVVHEYFSVVFPATLTRYIFVVRHI